MSRFEKFTMGEISALISVIDCRISNMLKMISPDGSDITGKVLGELTLLSDEIHVERYIRANAKNTQPSDEVTK